MSSKVKSPTETPASFDSLHDLRRRAELLVKQQATASAEAPQNPGSDDLSLMLHELSVHQIELEMQNEELRRAQVRLDAARSRYFDLYELAPVGYITISEAGLILQANLTAAALLHVSRASLIQQPFSRFIISDDQDNYYLLRRQVLLSDESRVCEVRIIRGGGATVWVQLTAVAEETESGVRELRLALTDITARKQAAAALLAANAELEAAIAVAQEASEAKSDFLSSLSHELRTPLNAMLGFAQLMQVDKAALTPAQHRNLDHIVGAGWYLLDLISDILDISLIEAGRVSVLPQSVVLAEVFQECQALMEQKAKGRGISLTFSAPAPTVQAMADRKRVKQVLINLISNAIKYNSDGGKVVVDYIVRPSGKVRILVSDTGPGLSAEKVGQLFQPYNRLGKRRSAEEGVGIGLALSKRLVEMMEGEIGVESVEGQGSVFWVDLKPMEQRQHGALTGPQVANVQRPPVSGNTAPHTLLCIEDDPASLTLMEEVIALRPDLRLLGAKTAQQGVDIARAELPDVVLMDINLPDMDGIKALQALAADPNTAHIPVVALSSDAMPREIEAARKAGFFRYMTKPINIAELVDVLDAVLQSGEGATRH